MESAPETGPAAGSTLHNLLEPVSLIRHFQEHPPDGFSTLKLCGGTPGFAAVFDLLTTMEPALLRKLDRWPFASTWRRFLRVQTAFVGTTVSEYALLPQTPEPKHLVRDLIEAIAPRYPFLIIKDLPTEAVLIGDEAFKTSRSVADACTENGFVLVAGQALAYVPIDFASTDEYLARLSHARRKNIRRKLARAANLTITETPTGHASFEDEALLCRMYELYLNVYRQSEVHFDRLTPEFFRAVLQDESLDGIVFMYQAGGELIGYNLCIRARAMLLDKYVGFAYPQSHQYNLYAVSWMHNIEYALSHGLRYYVAGWTDPEIKRSLGARFTFTEHAVYVRSALLRTLLKPFKRFFESDRKWQDGRVSRAHS